MTLILPTYITIEFSGGDSRQLQRLVRNYLACFFVRVCSDRISRSTFPVLSFIPSVDSYFPSLVNRFTIFPVMPRPKSTYSHVIVGEFHVFHAFKLCLTVKYTDDMILEIHRRRIFRIT